MSHYSNEQYEEMIFKLILRVREPTLRIIKTCERLKVESIVLESSLNILVIGSHHHQKAILVPDDKLNCFRFIRNFL